MRRRKVVLRENLWHGNAEQKYLIGALSNGVVVVVVVAIVVVYVGVGVGRTTKLFFVELEACN